jgi:Uma2 family endonuclease
MGIAEKKLTAQEYELRYSREKPYYEFWRGEAVQKSMPTWIHGFLQGILTALLNKAGYKAGSEVKLKIDEDLQLIPDVIATRGRIDSAYPVGPVEIVVEILSEEDRISRMLAKCKIYQDWGFELIYVVDPEARSVFQWMGNRLEEVDEIAGQSASEIWKALDRQLQ